MTRTLLRCASVTAMSTLAATSLAQAPAPIVVPLPAALTASHRIFLGNAGDQENADCLRAYNDFYADLAKLTRFSLVPSPGAADLNLAKLTRFSLVPSPRDADLILEMHYELTPGQTAGHDDPRRFRVLIIDPGTHVVLWSLVERTNYAVRQSKRDENLDEMVGHLASDFDALTSAQPPSNNSRTQHGITH